MRRRTLAALWVVLPPVIVLALFWYGRTHTPDYASGLFGQHGNSVNELKARLGTALLGLALVQLLLAIWMYGRLPGTGPAARPVRTTHRVIGVAALLLSLPIAQHCITAYGVQFTDSRIALHSVTGCFLYGAFAAKVIVVRHRRLPGWALPVAGGVLVCAIALTWYSAALWFLDDYHAPGL